MIWNEHDSIITEYQKIINLLDNTPNQLSKFRTKNWVEINDDAHGRYNTKCQIKIKTSMLKSSVYDYSDAYIILWGTISFQNTGTAANPNNRKNIIIKNCVLFTDCVSEINNAQIDNTKDIDIVIPICNLIEYSDNYTKISANTIEMNYFKMLMELLLVFLLIMITVLRLNLKQI